TTIAGGGSGSLGDGGQATAAYLYGPSGLAFDADGNLYVATITAGGLSTDKSRVRKIDKNGMITTVAGGGDPADFYGDGGPATSAWLHDPWGLTFDPQGNLYIADFGSGRLRKVDQQGIITTFAGGRP